MSKTGSGLGLLVLVMLLVCCKSQMLCALWDVQKDVCIKCADHSFFYYSFCVPISIYCATYNATSDDPYGDCFSCVANYTFPTPSNKQCLKIPFPTCATVDVDGICSSCISGYTYAAPNCTLTPIANCLTQVNTTCSACKTRFYLSANACIAVNVLCATYNSTNGSCLTCISGYTLANGSCNPTPIANCLTQVVITCNTCNNRYYLSANTCKVVSVLCVTYSATNGSCLTCGALYTLTNGTCVPTPILNCLTQVNTTCSACNTRYYLSTNACYAVNVLCGNYSPTNSSCLTCVTDYTLANGTCTPTPIPKCQTQTVVTCSLCLTGYYLYLNSCPAADSRCTSYSTTTGKCLGCTANFTPVDTVCLAVIAHCSAYALSGCTACLPLYTLFSNVCTPNPVANCQNQVDTVCSNCNDRFYLSSNACIGVHPLCATYDSNNGSCLTCGSQYTLTTGSCLPTPIPNCQTQVSTTCSLCLTGFYLNANACPTADVHCSEYSNGKCLACSSGFVPFDAVCLVSIANCNTYAADNSCSLCADGFLYLPANKAISSTATDQCVSVCPYNASVHTFADSTLKKCVQTCDGVNYGDFNSEGHPICTPNCIQETLFRDSSSKQCVAACPSENSSLQRSNSYGDPTTKDCVQSCPAGTFINLDLNRTCVSKCDGGKWGDSFTKHCTSHCSSHPATAQQYFGENSTQLCLASCPLPAIPDKTTSMCVPTPQSVFQGKWQASGNMAEQVKDVHNLIDASLHNVASFVFPTAKLARSISDALNAQWSTAWNVFVVKTDSLEHSNSVVYGYAFKDHWMWVNGYGQLDYSFIIWKDYNCQIWVDLVNPDPINTLPDTDATVVTDFVNSKIDDNPVDFFDPWVFAYDVASYLNGQDAQRSYTAVVSQGHITYYNARFCGFGGEYYCGVKTKDGFTLTYLLIRTR